MYALVQYKDNIYHISRSKNISNYKGVTKATYSDGRKYEASIIAKNGKLQHIFYFRVV